MLLSRRSLLAGALAPLVPPAGAEEHQLLALGAELQVLRQRVAALHAAGIAGPGWQRWNAAVVASVALAERIGRTPAHDLSGFAIKLAALACEWEDDIGDHQIEWLRALAREMAGRA